MSPAFRLLPCLGLLWLTPAALAEGPDDVASPLADRDEAARLELQAFVDEAVKGGLLSPTKPNARMATEEARSGVVQREAACHDHDPLNFGGFQVLEDYSDLVDYQSDAVSLETSETGDETLDAAKAHLALGLASEARALIAGRSDSAALALRAASALIEDRREPQSEAFSALATCHPSAQFWNGMARVIEGDPGGARDLNNTISAFRQLPVRLRAALAAKLVPALIKRDEAALADKILADFSEAHIPATGGLAFASALRDLARGEREAEAEVREYLLDPAFQDDALSALRATKTAIDPLHTDIVLDQQTRGAAEPSAGVTEGLLFTLERLSAKSRYPALLDILDSSEPSAHDRQTLIRGLIRSSLRRDLQDASPIRKLAALNVIINETETLPELSDLDSAASAAATEFGWSGMAAQIAATDDADAAFKRAIHAFNLGDDVSVFAEASEHAGHEELNLLAARAALRADDGFYYGVFEDRLALDKTSVRTLILDEALLERGRVSEAVYDRARLLLREENDAALRDALSLRDAAKRAAAPKPGPPLLNTPHLFSRSQGLLERLDSEGA